jgi:F-type H+-transporting ATPase subunit b
LELSWSTFILEIINFLVLVWILKRFFYRPVMRIIEKRRKSIDEKISAAEKTNQEAKSLQQQYEGRLTEWEREKQKSRESLQQELQAERKKLLDQLARELDAEKEKAQIVEERRKQEQLQHYQETAFSQGARFAAKLLKDLASPELEARLITLLISRLSNLPEMKVAALSKACKAPLDKILVSSAFDINDTQKEELNKVLQKICENTIPLEFSNDSELLAGVRISMGSWILRINLQDELSGFAALSQHETDI